MLEPGGEASDFNNLGNITDQWTPSADGQNANSTIIDLKIYDPHTSLKSRYQRGEG